jgi:hypothetical protein
MLIAHVYWLGILGRILEHDLIRNDTWILVIISLLHLAAIWICAMGMI